MARKEKSFFGKIMGGSLTEDEDDKVAKPVQVNSSADDDDEEYIEEELVEEELVEEEALGDYIEYETAPQAPAQQSYQQEVRQSQAAQEDWVSDYEGALNIDMYQTKDNVIIKSTIAGVSPEDVDITVANDMVTIKGTRQREENVATEDYFYQECYWGSFSRSVIVPVDIDSEEIEADLKAGILTIIIPKAAKAKTKKVKVKGL